MSRLLIPASPSRQARVVFGDNALYHLIDISLSAYINLMGFLLSAFLQKQLHFLLDIVIKFLFGSYEIPHPCQIFGFYFFTVLF